MVVVGVVVVVAVLFLGWKGRVGGRRRRRRRMRRRRRRRAATMMMLRPAAKPTAIVFSGRVHRCIARERPPGLLWQPPPGTPSLRHCYC